MDEDLVRQLRPDTILTQRLCDVCAVNYGGVARFAAKLPGPPRVVSLEPSSLADILRDNRTVAEVLGVPERAEAVIASFVGRIKAVRERAAGAPRRRCVLLEWIDPPFCAGHWEPELVEIAGGVEPIGRRGSGSVAIPWDAVVETAPEVLVLACCGYSVERTVADLPILRSYPGFEALPAAHRGEVYVVDGSRSSPRSCIRRAFAVSFPTAPSHASGDRPCSLAGAAGREQVSRSTGPASGSYRAVWTAWGWHAYHLSGEMSVGESLSAG